MINLYAFFIQHKKMYIKWALFAKIVRLILLNH